jgi:predicted ribosomally synthesized peptide with SipW-like signal peptide
MTRLRRKLSEEQGFSIVMAIVVLGIGLALISAAALAYLSSKETANRDSRVKRALQAANAGINVALYRMNQLNLAGLNVNQGLAGLSLPCLLGGTSVGVLSTQVLSLPSSDCPSVSEDLGGGASFKYVVNYGPTVYGLHVALNPTIVAVGQVGGVYRRVKATVSGLDPLTAVQSRGALTLNGTLLSPVAVTGDIRSNDSISLNANTTITGNATPGPGKSINSSGVVLGSRSAATNSWSVYPANTPPAASNNSWISAHCTGNCTFNASARTLTMNGTSLLTPATLTLDPTSNQSFSLCNLTMSGFSTISVPVATSKTYTIYIDDPANCSSGGGNVSISGNSTISNLNATAPSSLQLEVVGNSGTSTSVSISPSSLVSTPTAMTVYAPQSAVTLGNFKLSGSVVGKTVNLNAGTTVAYLSALANVSLSPLFPLFHLSQFSECSPSSTPNTTGC